MTADESIARKLAEDRFFTATASKPATDEQKAVVAQFRHCAVEFGTAIESLLPDSRNKSLALTHLEDALMRANRAVFS